MTAEFDPNLPDWGELPELPEDHPKVKAALSKLAASGEEWAPLTERAQEDLIRGEAALEPGYTSAGMLMNIKCRSRNGLYYPRAPHTCAGTPEIQDVMNRGFGGKAAALKGSGGARTNLTKAEQEQIWRDVVADRISDAANTIIDLAVNADNESVRFQAAKEIIDRELGKAHSVLTGKGGGPIQFEDVSKLSAEELTEQIAIFAAANAEEQANLDAAKSLMDGEPRFSKNSDADPRR